MGKAIIIIFLMLPSFLWGQKTADEKTFFKNLIKKEIGGAKPEDINTTKPSYYVKFRDEGNGPYTVTFSLLGHTDMNGDGIKDYVINRISEGSLGGNALSNSQFYFMILNKNGEVERQYEILEYAPFSYNTLGDVKFENGVLTATATQNFRTYGFNDSLYSTKLKFFYKDSNLYEASYITGCGMYKLDNKNIFKPDLPGVIRSRNIDMHNYTEVIFEEYKTKDTTLTLSITGCDNFNLKAELFLERKKPDIREITTFLRYLSANTFYKTYFTAIANDLDKTQRLNQGSKKIRDLFYTIAVSNNENGSSLLVSIRKVNNPRQTENWEITTRKK